MGIGLETGVHQVSGVLLHARQADEAGAPDGRPCPAGRTVFSRTVRAGAQAMVQWAPSNQKIVYTTISTTETAIRTSPIRLDARPPAT